MCELFGKRSPPVRLQCKRTGAKLRGNSPVSYVFLFEFGVQSNFQTYTLLPSIIAPVRLRCNRTGGVRLPDNSHMCDYTCSFNS